MKIDASLGNDDGDQQILAHVIQDKVLPPNDIQWVPAARQSQREQKTTQKDPGEYKKSITVNGAAYTSNVHDVIYFISKHHADKQETSFVDHGASRGMEGGDVMVVEKGERCATVNDIDGHTVQDLPCCTLQHKSSLIKASASWSYISMLIVAGARQFIQVVRLSTTKMLQSCGKQPVTLGSYVIPLHIWNGLAYMDMSKPTGI